MYGVQFSIAISMTFRRTHKTNKQTKHITNKKFTFNPLNIVPLNSFTINENGNIFTAKWSHQLIQNDWRDFRVHHSGRIKQKDCN